MEETKIDKLIIKPASGGRGLGLFYTGNEEIKKGEVVFSEIPFFLKDNIIWVKDNRNIFNITDSAALAYFSLTEPSEEIKKQINLFEVGEPLDEFKNKNDVVYKNEIERLIVILKKRYNTFCKTYMEKLIKNEIYRMSIYRIMCNQKYNELTGSIEPNQWGLFTFATRMNHSCDHNIEFQNLYYDKKTELYGKENGERTFIAAKNIKKGDELMFKYANKDELESDYGFKCLCSSCDDKLLGKDEESKYEKDLVSADLIEFDLGAKLSGDNTDGKILKRKRNSKKRNSKKRNSNKRSSNKRSFNKSSREKKSRKRRTRKRSKQRNI